MKSIVYISDFRLPFVLNFIKPLKKFVDYKKILIIERNNLQNEHVLSEFFDEIRYIDYLESLDSIKEHIAQIRMDHKIVALLTPGENAIEIGGEIRSTFGIPGLQRNQAEAVRNKWIMKQMLHQRGIRTSVTAIALSVSDYMEFVEVNGFPIIVKPLSGFGTINTFKISSINELNSYLENTRKEHQKDLLEEFINGKEFHCDSLVSKGNVVFSSVSQYLYNCLEIATSHKPPASITIPEGSNIEYIDRIKEVNKEVISALGINNSVTHAELFLTPEGEVVFGEIGARIGGAQVMPPCIKNTHGVDFFAAVSDLELGVFEFNRCQTDNNYTGMICFPTRAGIIEKISGIQDFKDIKGLIDFNVSYQVGQKVGDVKDTMTRSGFAIVEGDTFEDLSNTLLDMYDRFYIQVKAEEGIR
ncbi:ATP-grasp domain-containing protein [Paenibacillus sp. 19GGS1-52]|uniref:ATP-grasp domain-containing protein n=1 Tax=Paenibacillus sp. 19GGS1-52 TaxID=2758563 RepID=UPI001EFC1D06|nr:ATP-grasp domain-containing protein [Paenibacillus sp. 19GGS1-52]ULO06221.1 ATP-grasp domain-containing protein [Paenibacillus sp. 19GGS1-52]